MHDINARRFIQWDKPVEYGNVKSWAMYFMGDHVANISRMPTNGKMHAWRYTVIFQGDFPPAKSFYSFQSAKRYAEFSVVGA